MKKFLLNLLKDIPLLLLSIFLAFLVWVFASVSSDPTEEGRFPHTVTIETVGLDENKIITGGLPYTVSINLRAPNSVWRRISLERVQGKAVIDVTGLEAGTHQVPISVQVGISPIQIVSFSPNTATVTIEEYETREFGLTVNETGEIPTAFRADPAVLSQDTVKITGTVSQLDMIDKVAVDLDRTNATESIESTLAVTAYDESGKAVRDVDIEPDKVKVTQEIRMRGGYRILSVKLAVKGEIAQGYRVDNLSVDPGFVTVYSADKELLNSLTSYIETETIMLDEINSSTNRKIGLNVPDGVTLVGDPTVTMNVQVSAIEGTTTIAQIPVSVIGVDEDGNTEVTISPSEIDVYLFGPIVALSEIEPSDIHAVIEVQDLENGSYQIAPKVEISSSDTIAVQSLMPATIEVHVSAVEGSAEISPVPVIVTGIDDDALTNVTVTPSEIGVDLFGPVADLEKIGPADILAEIDVRDLESGTYQIAPFVNLSSYDTITVRAAVPETVSVEVSRTMPTEEPKEEEPAEENPAVSGMPDNR